MLMMTPASARRVMEMKNISLAELAAGGPALLWKAIPTILNEYYNGPQRKPVFYALRWMVLKLQVKHAHVKKKISWKQTEVSNMLKP